MYLQGHIGVSALILHFLEKKGIKIIFPVALFSSMLPDFIDKPLEFLFLLPGRFVGHMILTWLIVVMLGKGIATRMNRPDVFIYSYSLALGAMLHIIEDFRDPILLRTVFWPLFGWSLPSQNGRFDFLLGLKDPYYAVLEGIGLALVFLVGIDRGWEKEEFIKLGGILVAYWILYLSFYAIFIGIQIN